MTPLMCAARAGHASIVDLLLESGAKIDAECQVTRTYALYKRFLDASFISKTFQNNLCVGRIDSNDACG